MAPSCRLLLAACLGLTLSLPCDAQERRVRLELQDGTVVEGRLEAFAGRVYRVITADGRTREVAERDVARVAFEAAQPASTPCAVLAEVLRKAEASGALAKRVLGPRHYLLTETDRGPRERRYLLAAEVRKEADALVVELEVVPERGARRSPALFKGDVAGASYRLRSSVGLSDGRTRRNDFLGGAKELTSWRDEGSWSTRYREAVDREKEGTRGEIWADDLLPEEIVVFVLAPLQDQGLAPSFAFRLLRPGRMDHGGTLHRLRRLPGQTAALELSRGSTSEESSEDGREALRLSLATDGRLAGFETEPSVRAEAITPQRWAAELAAWGGERAAPFPSPSPSPATAADPGPPGPAARLLAAARGRGAEDPLLVERWFVRRQPPPPPREPSLGKPTPPDPAEVRRLALEAARVQLVHVVGRRAGETSSLEVTVETPGDPRKRTRAVATCDAQGRLAELVHEAVDPDGAAVSIRAARRGDRLEGVEERGPIPGWPTDVRRTALGDRLPPGGLPRALVVHGLTALGPLLEAPLELVALDPPDALTAGHLRGVALRLERRPVAEDERALALGPKLEARVPDGPRPAAAVVVTRPGEPYPVVVVFVDAAGAPLAHVEPSQPGQDVRFQALVAATRAEAEGLREDPQAVAAGRCKRAQDQAGDARQTLLDLHGKQQAFRNGDLDHDGEADFAASLEELGAAGLVHGALRAGVRLGYRLRVVRAEDAPGERWLAVADPLEPCEGAERLAITQDGMVLGGFGPFTPGPDAAPPAGAEGR